MITVYGMRISGNCWKASQILRLRSIRFEWVEVDSNSGETHRAEFLKINPNGKVPVVELDDGTRITELNAILAHFAEDTPWIPPSGLQRTRVLEWLFFEQYSHEPYIAVARNIISFRKEAASNVERLKQCRERGEHALEVMERRLSANPWLTESGPTIADLSLFAYTHVADEGGFELSRWPGVVAWVARVRSLPGIVPLK